MQSIARDLWDYDMAAPPVLFEAEIGGKKRKVVAEGSKAGQWWCWDAATGEEIYGQVIFPKQDHPIQQRREFLPIRACSVARTTHPSPTIRRPTIT